MWISGKLDGRTGMPYPVTRCSGEHSVEGGKQMAVLNAKAESFKKFVEKKDPKAFVVDPVEKDPFHTVVFRSHLTVDGTPLQLIVVLDDSAFGIIRVLLAPKALKETNQAALLKLLNTLNSTYKSFKFYLDKEESLLMDTCVIFHDEHVDGNMMYALFQMISKELDARYKDIMKTIWE